MIRFWLYILSGIISALVGWNLSQIIIDFGFLSQMRELIVFPCIAASLAIGMVLNEIFISNPARLSLCLRKAKVPFLIALGLGLVLGLIAGGIAQMFFAPELNFPTRIVRILGWLLIGLAVGVAEGFTWWWQSEASGDKKRFYRRLSTSVSGAVIAALISALIFELCRNLVEITSRDFRIAEDIIGFCLLGLMLGLAFNFTSSPSYNAALRAGAGFEYKGERYVDQDPSSTQFIEPYPSIRIPFLRFIHDSEEDEIEEGTSIQLPAKGKINIGSDFNEKADISIPGLPVHVGFIEINNSEAFLRPNKQAFRNIAINGKRLTSRRPVPLKHNSVITFYSSRKEDHYEEKIYRFVYYNRFLDPQA